MRDRLLEVFRRPDAWIAAALVVWLAASAITSVAKPEAPRRPMSFENRLLLNRAAITSLPRIEVMLLVRDGTISALSALAEQLGGHVHRVDAAVGYLRVEVPTERLVELVATAAGDAYQIASFSRGSWYRDGPPRSNAEIYRGFEVSAPAAEAESTGPDTGLVLSLQEARRSGYTADDDVGIASWLAKHPTFDGRGVTIALLESGQAAFTSSVFGTATSSANRPARVSCSTRPPISWICCSPASPRRRASRSSKPPTTCSCSSTAPRRSATPFPSAARSAPRRSRRCMAAA